MKKKDSEYAIDAMNRIKQNRMEYKRDRGKAGEDWRSGQYKNYLDSIRPKRLNQKEQLQAGGYARRLLKIGVEYRDLEATKVAYEIYRKLGRLRRGYVRENTKKAIERRKKWQHPLSEREKDIIRTLEFNLDVTLSDEDIRKSRESKGKGIDTRLDDLGLYIPIIIGLIAGLFFLSPNLTGNAIGSLNKTYTDYTGLILSLIALGCFYIFSRKK